MSKVILYGGNDEVSEMLETVVSKEGYTLVDFFATWCGPCRALGPVLDELSEEVDFPIVKADVDNYRNLAAHYGVRSIPTMVLFENGKIKETLIGGRSKEELKSELEKLMK